MAREEAEKVQRLIKEVVEQAKPLKDKELSSHLEKAAQHIEKKLDKQNQ